MSMAAPTDLKALFEPEKANGINAFIQARSNATVYGLDSEETDAIKMAINSVVLSLDKISPKLSQEFLSQSDAFVKWMQVGKGNFPVQKKITYPSQPGTLGVLPLFPQIIKYTTAPSSTNQGYTDYTKDIWDITNVAGTISHLFGSGTDGSPTYYKAASTGATPAQGGNAFLVIAQNGVIEKGSTPAMRQWRILAQTQQPYGIYTDNPLADETIEVNRTLFQHGTLGMVPVYRDLGLWWGYMPDLASVSTIKLLGLALYEHELFSTLTEI